MSQNINNLDAKIQDLRKELGSSVTPSLKKLIADIELSSKEIEVEFAKILKDLEDERKKNDAFKVTKTLKEALATLNEESKKQSVTLAGFFLIIFYVITACSFFGLFYIYFDLVKGSVIAVSIAFGIAMSMGIGILLAGMHSYKEWKAQKIDTLHSVNNVKTALVCADTLLNGGLENDKATQQRIINLLLKQIDK